MTQTDEIHRLIRLWEMNAVTSFEFQSKIMDRLGKLPVPERHAALQALSAHPNEDIRQAASDFQRHERQEG